jgi:hypothetical protein
VACGSRTTLSGHLRRHRHYSSPFIFIPRGREGRVIQTAREKGLVMSEELKQQREQEGVIVPAAKRGALTNGGGSLARSYSNSTEATGGDGTPCKFDPKSGEYVTKDGERLPAGEYVVPYPEIRTGWIRFFEKGTPPERLQGKPFDGFVPEPRPEVPESEWKTGLNGEPEHPWAFQILVPLIHIETQAPFGFQTVSWSGRKAADSLIRACIRMEETEPGYWPVIKLGVSERKGSEGRISYKAPRFDRVGKVRGDDISTATTSVADDLNDEVPF